MIEISVQKLIEKAIDEFNKYRSPEANAQLLSLEGSLLTVEFSGHFCRTCGFYDYFEDFRLMLEDAGVKAKTGEIKETGNGAVVSFSIASDKHFKRKRKNHA